MKNKYMALIIVIITGAAAIIIAHDAGAKEKRAIQEKVKFIHNPHINLNINCAACHAGAADEQYASIPGIETCILCHKGAAARPALKALLELDKEGGKIDWNRGHRLPAHVNFSHRRHVKIAKLKCTECHQGIMRQTSTSARRHVILKMKQCLKCHRQSHVTTDCAACHR